MDQQLDDKAVAAINALDDFRKAVQSMPNAAAPEGLLAIAAVQLSNEIEEWLMNEREK